MHQHDLAGLDLVGLAQQILRRDTLEDQRRHLLVGHTLRHLDQPVRRDVAVIGVGAESGAHVGDPIAHLEFADLRADGFDHPGCLVAEPGRQRQRINALALINVDEIETDRGPAAAALRSV